MAKKKVKDSEEEVETIEDGVEEEKVRITLPVMLKINGREFHPGPHIVSVVEAETMMEMVDKKVRADRSIFIGNNYLVERMLDRTLKVTKVESLDKG